MQTLLLSMRLHGAPSSMSASPAGAALAGMGAWPVQGLAPLALRGRLSQSAEGPHLRMRHSYMGGQALHHAKFYRVQQTGFGLIVPLKMAHRP